MLRIFARVLTRDKRETLWISTLNSDISATNAHRCNGNFDYRAERKPMVSFDVIESGIEFAPVQAQRKRWIPPRVITSEIRQDTAGGILVLVSEITSPGLGTIS